MNSLRVVLPALAALGVANVSLADHDEVRSLQRSGHIVAFERVLETVKRLHPNARILEVELERKRERYIYELEVLGSKGIAYELKIDAATGEALSQERER